MLPFNFVSYLLLLEPRRVSLYMVFKKSLRCSAMHYDNLSFVVFRFHSWIPFVFPSLSFVVLRFPSWILFVFPSLSFVVLRFPSWIPFVFPSLSLLEALAGSPCGKPCFGCTQFIQKQNPDTLLRRIYTSAPPGQKGDPCGGLNFRLRTLGGWGGNTFT